MRARQNRDVARGDSGRRGAQRGAAFGAEELG